MTVRVVGVFVLVCLLGVCVFMLRMDASCADDESNLRAHAAKNAQAAVDAAKQKAQAFDIAAAQQLAANGGGGASAGDGKMISGIDSAFFCSFFFSGPKKGEKLILMGVASRSGRFELSEPDHGGGSPGFPAQDAHG